VGNGWTSARRAAQRKAIYRWRPWEKSTGPKSKVGKAAIAANAFKHGGRSRILHRELQAIRRLIDASGEA
jgi:hypothetical protein